MADNTDDFDAAGWVAQSARLLNLTLEASWTPGVVANLRRAQAIVAPVLDFDLPDEAEEAPVFRP